MVINTDDHCTTSNVFLCGGLIEVSEALRDLESRVNDLEARKFTDGRGSIGFTFDELDTSIVISNRAVAILFSKGITVRMFYGYHANVVDELLSELYHAKED